MDTAVIIPFRDRGTDPRRAANLEIVQAWWYAHGFEPRVVSDGLEGTAQFNRHRAYNRGAAEIDAEVYVFAEADMLIHPHQILGAVSRAKAQAGLVVPFSQYRYLSDEVTQMLREDYHDMPSADTAARWALPQRDPLSVFGVKPESVIDQGRSIGAVNVVSADTLGITGGFPEATRGNWYDDNIVEEGFAFLTRRRTRWMTGPAVHLYHLPGHKGDHLTDEDKQATEDNQRLLTVMRRNIRNRQPMPVKALMATRVDA